MWIAKKTEREIEYSNFILDKKIKLTVFFMSLPFMLFIMSLATNIKRNIILESQGHDGGLILPLFVLGFLLVVAVFTRFDLGLIRSISKKESLGISYLTVLRATGIYFGVCAFILFSNVFSAIFFGFDAQAVMEFKSNFWILLVFLGCLSSAIYLAFMLKNNSKLFKKK